MHTHKLRSIALTSLLAWGLAGCALTPTRPPDVFLSPYKHLNTYLPDTSFRAAIRVDGASTPLVSPAGLAILANGSGVHLAFASGMCGREVWGGLDAQQVADANIPALHAAGVRYVISTGGEGNQFHCDSAAGMEQFVARYDSPFLEGFDFDIEAQQTPEDIRSLVHQIKLAQLRRPHLRFSFTLATFAASDGSQASLNALGQTVLQAVREEGISHFVINLMVMNFGDAVPQNCVVREARCDMAASAQQAAVNFHQRYAVPYSQIALTPMLGVNDVMHNVFTPDDARALAQFAKKMGLAGLHFWSLDRDGPCLQGEPPLAATCSGLASVPATDFLRAFRDGVR